MDFPNELLLPQRIIFRKGSCLDIAAESLEFGANGMIIYGRSLVRSGAKDKILGKFSSSLKIECFCRLGGEPDLDEISTVIDKARCVNARWVLGIGGGSVLDLAKAAAGLFNAREKPIYYQEGGQLEEMGIPFIAVPTTAGTGSEATTNSVIINKGKKVKLSIRDKSFLARKVILDAELLSALPEDIAAYAAMDALVQAYESFTSKNATWFSQSLALKAIELIDKNILGLCKKPKEEGSASLLLASFLGGVALNSSRLGVIHGIAHPLGVLYNLPHGLVCAVCFIPTIKLNKETIGKKYDVISGIVGMDFLRRVEILLAQLKISSPFKGQAIIEKEKIIEETLKSGSTFANPKNICRKDVEFILNEVF